MLEEGLDGLVLLVKLGEIRNDILDNVGVGKRVDLGLLLRVGWNTACGQIVSSWSRYCNFLMYNAIEWCEYGITYTSKPMC